MKKLIIAVVLAVVLIAGGLGGFVYATNNSHEPMTGQKLVGYGFYGEFYLEELGETIQLHSMFVFTNPDGVSEITIDRVFIYRVDGEVLYDGPIIGQVPFKWTPYTEPMKPHEIRAVELHDYIGLQDLIMPMTVEIFWSGAKEGLPLTGWARTGNTIFDDAGNLVELSTTESQMVNMEQTLTPEKVK